MPDRRPAAPNPLGEALTLLAAAYPRTPMSDETVAVYSLLLRDLPGEAVKAAAVDLARRSKWLPTAAEIREAVAELTGPDRPTAAEAWSLVTRWRSAWADWRRGDPPVPDLAPDVREAVDGLGVRLTDPSITTAQVVSARARFIELYEALEQRRDRERRRVALGLPARPALTESTP